MTLNVYGLVVIPVTETGVVPSEYVRFHGEVPVKVTDMGVEEPSQIVLSPEITAVGLG